LIRNPPLQPPEKIAKSKIFRTAPFLKIALRLDQ
jgi:hypothetical protein